MELLKSKKLKIPDLYFITDRDEINDLPIGVPFIYGDNNDKEHIVRLLEYEILYQRAVKTGYPFNFKRILEDNGYDELESYDYDNPAYIDCITEDGFDVDDYLVDKDKLILNDSNGLLKKYIKDSAAYLDIAKIKELKVFPIWLDSIEDAVHTNLHNFATYNPYMYNKKLELMCGGIDLTSPPKNLIIIDISASIPKAVSSTCITLAKNLAETFYADLIITGGKSVMYEYNDIRSLDAEKLYETIGMSNECRDFRRILFSEHRKYKTAIVFGDNHTPCDNWDSGTKTIRRDEAQRLCDWKIDKLISFHTGGTDYIAGYADFFKPNEVTKIKDWVKYLK